MPLSSTKESHIKRTSRWLLVLFVLSWINLAIQAPVHAAMKQDPSMPCHCGPSLCDTVANMENQSDDGLLPLIQMALDFQLAFVSIDPIQPMQAQLDIRLHRAILDYRETRPPPLLLNTLLLI